jgi:ectoine hydroxylase-related dioxygenase (phytanoyl-CoA dioxygenase family)
MGSARTNEKKLNHLTREQVDFYQEHGFLRIQQVFDKDEIDEMDREFMDLIAVWSNTDQGWTGPWRRVYMDAVTDRDSKLTAMHDLQFYAQSWAKAVVNPKLCDSLVDLLGPNVELHHTTMHVKPPQSGHPFPMHQDWAFYKHNDGRYVDVLVHLDDTDDENGCIRFLDGSHKNGALEHITQSTEGPCTPHLSTEKFRLEDTVPVPAKRGDVVLFNLHTVHGSRVNRTNKLRRLIRMGYRDPENIQTEGQSFGRFGLMVRGVRPRTQGRAGHCNETP